MNTWAIESITSVPRFLAAIARSVPAVRIVSFEIHNACPEALQVYARHRSAGMLRPLRDTAFPKTRLYFCVLTPALADDLENLLRDHAVKEVLWHVKGFSVDKLLFAIHDADCGDAAFLSSHVDREAALSVGAAVGRPLIKIETHYDWDADQRPTSAS